MPQDDAIIPDAVPESSGTTPRACELHPLDCLEVWGGSNEIDSAVSVTGLDVWVWSRPAEAGGGGDIYLVSMCACAEVSRFLIADVTGHDTEAADVATRLRKLMRRHINKPDQTRLACSLNHDFDGMQRHGKFATAVLATFFPPSRHLILCNAGHPAPLWYQARERRWVTLDHTWQKINPESRNLPLGIFTDSDYVQFAVRLERNDLVLVYTDGLTETQDARGRMLNESGLLRLIRQLDTRQPDQFMSELRARVVDFAGHQPPHDDTTLLLLSPNGQQPRRQSLVQRIKVTAKMLGLLPAK
ncbi:MAG: SpoIIE family protein phosphatase [Planctomycetes bacterium]|nr:SpoIIE family protein phosphatase [Planctomycetota bacterium]